MKTRIPIVSVALLIAICGMAYTQQPGSPDALIFPTPLPPPSLPVASAIPKLDSTPPIFTPPIAVPPEPSVDQLLDKLEALRSQKAELEKQEQELLKVVRQKLAKQSDRMGRLGIANTDPAVVPKPQVPKLPSTIP